MAYYFRITKNVRTDTVVDLIAIQATEDEYREYDRSPVQYFEILDDDGVHFVGQSVVLSEDEFKYPLRAVKEGLCGDCHTIRRVD